MSVQELAMRLPRVEKLRLMEALWDDLSHEAAEVDSPSWHEAVLREAGQHVAAVRCPSLAAPLLRPAASRHRIAVRPPAGIGLQPPVTITPH